MALYLLKSPRYENIWWRVENRVHDLAEEKGALDIYHISSIIRAFSKSQDNQMAGSDKLFIHLEPLVKQLLPKMSADDLSLILYGYSIREVGNPEIYKAFDSQLMQRVRKGEVWSYPVLFHVIYYLMFTENKNPKIWEHVVHCTVQNDYVLPITYYKPFKFSWFYLKHHFPQLADW